MQYISRMVPWTFHFYFTFHCWNTNRRHSIRRQTVGKHNVGMPFSGIQVHRRCHSFINCCIVASPCLEVKFSATFTITPLMDALRLTVHHATDAWSLIGHVWSLVIRCGHALIWILYLYMYNEEPLFPGSKYIKRKLIYMAYQH